MRAVTVPLSGARRTAASTSASPNDLAREAIDTALGVGDLHHERGDVVLAAALVREIDELLRELVLERLGEELAELGLLEVLLQRIGRLVSKEQLVDHLCEWGEEVSNNAIEVYVHRLRKKLESSGVNVRTQYGRGYLLDYLTR